MPFKFFKTTILISIAVLTSCFHTKYISKHEIKPFLNNTQNELMLLINDISLENQLTIDQRFNETDTIAFYGKPYHYFKYWTTIKDSTFSLTVEYTGVFGKRKKPPYDMMIKQINDSINQRFNVINFEFDEKSNKK